MSSSNKQKAVRDTRAKASFNHTPTIKIRTTLNDYFDRQKCWAADAVGVLDEVLKLVSQSVVEIEGAVIGEITAGVNGAAVYQQRAHLRAGRIVHRQVRTRQERAAVEDADGSASRRADAH